MAVFSTFRQMNAFVSLARHHQSAYRFAPYSIKQRSFPIGMSRQRNMSSCVNPDHTDRTVYLRIPTPEDMEEVAALLSVSTESGDVILMGGDLGAGKTCFSRGFIRARTGFEGRITSPTYLLSNTYRAADDDASKYCDLKIYHMDLYRLNGTAEELAPLDLDCAFSEGIALVEWPERLVDIPENRLDITLTIDMNKEDNPAKAGFIETDEDERSRIMKLVPFGERWTQRLQFYDSEGYFEDLMINNE